MSIDCCQWDTSIPQIGLDLLMLLLMPAPSAGFDVLPRMTPEADETTMNRRPYRPVTAFFGRASRGAALVCLLSGAFVSQDADVEGVRLGGGWRAVLLF